VHRVAVPDCSPTAKPRSPDGYLPARQRHAASNIFPHTTIEALDISITHRLIGADKVPSYSVRLGPATPPLADNFRALSIWRSTGRHSRAFNRSDPRDPLTNTSYLHGTGLLRPSSWTL